MPEHLCVGKDRAYRTNVQPSEKTVIRARTTTKVCRGKNKALRMLERPDRIILPNASCPQGGLILKKESTNLN